jgi:hypothetical protein
MRCLSRALERVKGVVCGRRTSGKHTGAYLITLSISHVVDNALTPDAWSARIRHARARRATAPVPIALGDTGPLARAFMVTPQKRRHTWQVTR